MTDRREFLKLAGLTAAAVAADGALQRALAQARPAAPRAPTMDPATRELLMEALNAAKLSGATYADARIGRQRQSSVSTRERQITNVSDTETMGCGVRALVDGTWGFAATRTLTKEGVAVAAREAAAIAKANRMARDRAVELLPSPVYQDASWQSAFTIDPWTISVEEKADLLLRANAEAIKVPNVQFVNSSLFLVKDERNYANTDGSVITQSFIRVSPNFTATAVAPDRSDFQRRSSDIAPMGRGWEYVLESDLVGNGPASGARRPPRSSPPRPVEVGRYDLILHPSHLWLTIHESIGHPTELDRAMGYEANYAGTSFIAPPDKMLGHSQVRPRVHEHPGRPLAGGRPLHDRLR